MRWRAAANNRYADVLKLKKEKALHLLVRNCTPLDKLFFNKWVKKIMSYKMY